MESENNNSNVFEEFKQIIKELADSEDKNEEDSSTKELPKLPEKQTQTFQGDNINQLYDEYMKGNAVEFPPWVKIENEKVRISPQELFIYISENYHILVVKLGNAKGVNLYFYENGYYHLWLESDCKAFIKSFLPIKIRQPKDWEFVYREFLTEYSNIEESNLNADENIINFRNGILNIDTEELLPHSPEYLCTIQIHYDWDPKVMLSTAKVTMKFLNDITMENADDKATILEYIGATITNIYGWRFKKFLVLKGKGNTGKSVLLDLVIFILGLDNIFASDIKKLHSNFGLAGAYGKRLICCGDMKFASLAEIDIIKELTGGDFVNLEAKYQNSFTTKYKGLMWFNCNDLPKFSRR